MMKTTSVLSSLNCNIKATDAILSLSYQTNTYNIKGLD